MKRFSFKLDEPTTLIDLFNIANRLGLDFGNSVFTLVCGVGVIHTLPNSEQSIKKSSIKE